jgi:hypothetical protein
MPFNDGISNAVAPVTEVYLLVLSKVHDTYSSTVGSFTVEMRVAYFKVIFSFCPNRLKISTAMMDGPNHI